MYKYRTKEGVFYIVPYHRSGWKLLLDKEIINDDYIAAQDAVDDLVDGLYIQGMDGKTSDLGIPADIRDWVRCK